MRFFFFLAVLSFPLFFFRLVRVCARQMRLRRHRNRRPLPRAFFAAAARTARRVPVFAGFIGEK